MTAAAAALKFTLIAMIIVIIVVVVCGEVVDESLRCGERKGRSTSTSTSATTSDSHALAATVGTSSAGGRSVIGGVVTAWARVTVGTAASRGKWELETRSLSLLLCLFGCLLGIGEG